MPAADIDKVAACVHSFARRSAYQISRWRREIVAAQHRGERTVLWGGGSKAVAFLTTLGAGEEIDCAVDINPGKQDTYLAGTGHPVVAPARLKEAPPDRVIVMNPVYMAEIRRDLERLGLAPALVPVTAFAEPREMVA